MSKDFVATITDPARAEDVTITIQNPMKLMV